MYRELMLSDNASGSAARGIVSAEGVFNTHAITRHGEAEPLCPGPDNGIGPNFYDFYVPDTRLRRHADMAIASAIASKSGLHGMHTGIRQGALDPSIVFIHSQIPKELTAAIDQMTPDRMLALGRLTEVAIRERRKQNPANLFNSALEEIIENGDTGRILLTMDQQLAQQPLDSVDALSMRYGTRTAQPVDTSYLYSDFYNAMRHFPFENRQHIEKFLSHMIGGFFWHANSHLYLYLNHDPSNPKGPSSGIEDFNSVRPGNFLFHDMMLLEHRLRDGDEVPLDLLSGFLIEHALYGSTMDRRDETDEAVALTHRYDDGDSVSVTLYRPTERPYLPQRFLKTEDGLWAQYGTKHYVAELLAIFNHMDEIASDKGYTSEAFDTLKQAICLEPDEWEELERLFVGTTQGSKGYGIPGNLFKNSQIKYIQPPDGIYNPELHLPSYN